MNTELKVLKNIFEAKDKASVRLILNRLGYGLDYLRFICKKLEERNLVKLLSRDLYKITPKGERELAKRGLIKKPFQKKRLKIENPVWKTVRMTPHLLLPKGGRAKNIKLRPNFGKTVEEKLGISKKIEKTAAFLRKFRI